MPLYIESVTKVTDIYCHILLWKMTQRLPVMSLLQLLRYSYQSLLVFGIYVNCLQTWNSYTAPLQSAGKKPFKGGSCHRSPVPSHQPPVWSSTCNRYVKGLRYKRSQKMPLRCPRARPGFLHHPILYSRAFYTIKVTIVSFFSSLLLVELRRLPYRRASDFYFVSQKHLHCPAF